MISTLSSWLSLSDNRAKLFAVLAVILFASAGVGALTEHKQPYLTVDTQHPSRNTLIALQGYQHEGRAIEVNPAGNIVWQYTKPDDVFDVEALGPNRIQMATANDISDENCPTKYQNDGYKNCVQDSLLIVQKNTKKVLWNYSWYDAKLHNHELHDADHYTVNGKDRWVMVDMGNDRVFAVNRDKQIVWQWNATDTYTFPDGMDKEGDWTHVNDVDRIRPGVFRISLRNFDTVADLHVHKNGSIRVVPVVGPNSYSTPGKILYEQHNPDTLANHTLLVADSEHDRVVEIQNNTTVWTYGGSGMFDWPRDADRLRNGHTLITDSYNDRVVEINRKGKVVWAIKTGSLPYEADRLPGEGSHGPTASQIGIPNRTQKTDVVNKRVGWGIAMAKYVLPNNLAQQLVTMLFGLLALVGTAVEHLR